MYQLFKKGEEIRSFQVENNKVFTTVIIGECSITNPTLEQFKSLGWEEYTMPEPEPYVPTLEQLVERAIRIGLEEDNYEIHYSTNQEFHINRLMNNPNHTQEDIEKYNTYNTFVERCIAWAKTQPHRDEEDI